MKMAPVSLATIAAIFFFISLHFPDGNSQDLLEGPALWDANPDVFKHWNPPSPSGGLKNATWTGTYLQEALEHVADVCGWTRLCNASLVDTSRYKSREYCSVCDYCYCDKGCVTYGDCCLDKMFEDMIQKTSIQDTPNLSEASSFSSCFDIRTHKTTQGNDLDKLRIISSCPRDFKNNDVIEKCNKGRTTYDGVRSKISIDELWDIWPAMSKQTSISYRNQACAKCHNDHHSLEFWNIQVSCGGEAVMPTGLTKVEVLQHYLDQTYCPITFEAPKGAMKRKCSYPIDRYSITGTCNSTGSRSSFNPILWKACETFPTTALRNGQVYANLFCTLCQEEVIIGWQPFCGYQGPFSFFFMISPSAIQDVTSVDEMTCGCPENQALDPFKNTCRRVLCPQGFKLSRDHRKAGGDSFLCVDDNTLTKGMSYLLNLKLTSEDDIVSPAAAHELFKQISENLMKEFKAKLHPVYPFNFAFNEFTTFLYPTASHQRPTTSLAIGISTKFMLTDSTSPSSLAANLIDISESVWNIKLFYQNDEVVLSFNSTLTQGPNDMIALTATTEPRTRASVPLRDVDESIVVFNNKDSRSVFVSSYAEVKKTLSCPYLVLEDGLEKDFYSDVDIENNDLLKEKSVLIYNQTGVNLSFPFTDFHISSQGITIVCAQWILNSWQEVVDQGREEKENKKAFGKGLELTSIICLSVSCVCFVITLITYAMFPSLRTLPGKNTMALVTTMLVTMTLSLVIPFFDTWTVACQIVGVATHFFLLSSVTWMVICTYRMYKIFTEIFNHSGDKSSSSRCFIKYISVSILIPVTIISATIITNYFIHSNDDDDDDGKQNPSNDMSKNQTSTENTDPNRNSSNHPINTKETKSCDTSKLTSIGYGEGVCYISNQLSVLLAAALPIILAVLINCGFFCMTIASMRKMSAQQKTVRKEPQQQMFIYIKLCALTGLNWLPGLLSVFIESQWLWFAFLLLAGLQGLYVLVAFVLNARVLKLYKAKFCGQGSRSRDYGTANNNGTSLSKSNSKQTTSKTNSTNSVRCDDVITTENKVFNIEDDKL